MLDNELDRSIDEVAREMTAGEPGSDFRARVVARLDERPRVAWKLWIPAVVAAVVLIAAAVASRQSPGTSLSPVASSVRLQPGPQAPTVRRTPDTTDGKSPAASGLPRAATHSRVVRVPVTPSPFDDDTPSIDLPRIAVDALPPDRSLDLKPLDTIAPIAITPIDAEGEQR